MPELPVPVTTYLTTPKSEVGPLLDTLFAPDAVVHDEGRNHVGIDAIRAWTDAVVAAFTFTRTVTGSAVVGDATVVDTRLEGDFPGSPVDLHHHFTVSGGRISALTICP
ncbi:nuclear transport factor 2 family protein [Pseudonocardia sp. GCM10023141]|uniref:nuclear transport factor 2 family protein n=1 Tax=Pseudonocardia sp. GCM10023141 TaxID=3252653 RepID=UPI0036161011